MSKFGDPTTYPDLGTPAGTETTQVRQASSGANKTLTLTGLATWVSSVIRGAIAAFSKTAYVAQSTPTFAASFTPDLSAMTNNIKLTMTNNITVNAPTNPVAGMVLNMCLDQDATGSRSITLNAVFHVVGTTPAWGTAANARNFLSAYYDGTVWRYSGGPVA